MKRNFHTDIGFITITEAANIMLKVLNEPQTNIEHWKDSIRRKATKGELGGKRYGLRMFQVREKEVTEFALFVKEERARIPNIFTLMEEAEKEPAVTAANSTADSLLNGRDTLMELYQDGIIPNADMLINAMNNLINKHIAQ